MQFIAAVWFLWLVCMAICLVLGFRKFQQNSHAMQQEALSKFKEGDIGLPKPRTGFVPYFVCAAFFGVLELLAIIVGLINLIKA